MCTREEWDRELALVMCNVVSMRARGLGSVARRRVMTRELLRTQGQRRIVIRAARALDRGGRWGRERVEMELRDWLAACECAT